MTDIRGCADIRPVSGIGARNVFVGGPQARTLCIELRAITISLRHRVVEVLCVSSIERRQGYYAACKRKDFQTAAIEELPDLATTCCKHAPSPTHI